MGSEYAGYTADITVSFPANGKFTEKQKFVYETCYDANKKVIAAMKPGIERERERESVCVCEREREINCVHIAQFILYPCDRTILRQSRDRHVQKCMHHF